MSIHINTINIIFADNSCAADALDPDHAVDALDPEVFEEAADPVMPDEEPEHSGLDPQQELAAAISKSILDSFGHHGIKSFF